MKLSNSTAPKATKPKKKNKDAYIAIENAHALNYIQGMGFEEYLPEIDEAREWHHEGMRSAADNGLNRLIDPLLGLKIVADELEIGRTDTEVAAIRVAHGALWSRMQQPGALDYMADMKRRERWGMTLRAHGLSAADMISTDFEFKWRKALGITEQPITDVQEVEPYSDYFGN